MNNLTNYEINDAPMMMDIRSETLEPINGTSGSSKRFTFRLDQAGYLDQNSLLLFKAQAGAGKTKVRANCMNGGLGAIKRVVLQVGDYVINDVQGCDIISTLRNLSTMGTSQKNNVKGWYFQNQFWSKVLEAPDTKLVPTGAVQGQGGVGSILPDPNSCGSNMGDISAAGNTGAVVNSCLISDDQNNNQQFGIPLGTILPSLQGRTLPLFLFQQYRILITVEFHDAPNWVNDLEQVNNQTINVGTGANQGMAGLINGVSYHDVKLQVDYIILPAEVQNKDMEETKKDGGFKLSFFDSIKIEKNVPTATAGQEQSVEHRIGADNKEVHKIYMIKKLTDLDKTINNIYHLDGRCDAQPQEEYNVNIDGVDVFQEFKFNPASQYDETTNCLGADLKVDRPLYFADDNSVYYSLGSYGGGYCGNYKPLCLDLSNGQNQIAGGGRNIGAYPVIWKYKRKSQAAIPNLAPALNGSMNVDYYVLCSKMAVIQSTIKGTNVVVSY
tara:strand:- start:677 stop:2167 length:1491 start_codon:yes stop_codon:yes gene_type:complete